MKKIILTLLAFSFAVAPVAVSQTIANQSPRSAAHSQQPSDQPLFFPHNWIRGFTDFAVAPSHNEPDLGRCMFPQPASAGGATSQCTAYPRYLLSGYLEIQPLGRTLAKHLFFFFEPRFSFGKNIPQISYTASMEPMAYDRAVGAGFELPRNFQVRVTQHQVDFLGRYSNSLGPADLHTNGPYGLYTTVSVRWTFGGYGRNGAPAAY